MALSDVTKTQAQTSASAPTAGAPAGTKAPEVPTGAGKKSGDPRHAKLVATGHALREKMTDEEKQLEGSKSDKVAFVAALGDPNKPSIRKEKKQDLPSHKVVGYAFKALEDMDVPRADLKSNFQSFMDVGEMTTEHVKAGETFYLNIFETGALISESVYAGSFSGEGTTVTLGVKHSQNRKEPLPVLNKQGAGSIKEGMILVADMIGASETSKGTPKVKPEFASKFGVLYEKRVSGKSGSSSSRGAQGESIKDIAKAFNAFIRTRG